jgi:hypothetical protein
MANKIPLDTLKKLFIKGLDYSRQQNGFYISNEEELSALQIKKVQSATTFQEFASAVQIDNYSRQFGYNGIPALENESVLKYTNFQFGNTLRCLYTMACTDDTTGFTFQICRTDIAPPSVIKEMGLRPEDCCVWILNGGYGQNEQWSVVPFEWLDVAQYEAWSPTTFHFEGAGYNYIRYVKFSSLEPMDFRLELSYTDDIGNSHHIKSTFVARLPASFLQNAQVGGGAFIDNRRTTYVYPRMTVEFEINDSAPRTGFGIVRRSIRIPPPSNFIKQSAFVTALNTKMSFRQTFHVHVQFPLYQYYIELRLTNPIEVGIALPHKTLIRFEIGARVEYQDAKVEVIATDTVQYAGSIFPSALLLSINYNRIQLKAPHGQGVSVNAWFQGNYFLPCIANDSDFNEGMGFVMDTEGFNAKTWTTLSLGTQHPVESAAMIRQPRVNFNRRLFAHFVIISFNSLRVVVLVLLVMFCVYLCAR